MKRILPFLLLLLLLPLLGRSVFGAEPESKLSPQPNILFLIIDDLNADISSVGGPIQTPNIDALAEDGVQFTRMYVQQPVCAASRASFLTGLRPNTTGVDYPYSYYFVEEVQKKTGIISHFFADKGYYVKQFGKVHHNLPNEFQQPSNSPQKGKFVSDKMNADAKALGGHTQVPYERLDVGADAFVDGKVAQDVVHEIESLDPSKPFCLLAGFVKPHLPFSAPEQYWNMYDRDAIDLPVPTALGEGISSYAVNPYYLQQYKWETSDPDQPFSDAYAKLLKHSYYASASFVDAQVGRVVDALEANGLDQNTIVVLIADHGFLLGEQNYWGKTNLFEKGLRVPFVVTWKDHFVADAQTDALVEAVDIFPTLVDLAGFEIPDYLEGTSLFPVLENPDLPWKRGVFSQQPRGMVGDVEGISLRTDRYRYSEWVSFPKGEVLERELYDYDRDPDETRNLANDEEYRAVVKALAKQLHEGWKQQLPEGVVNHSNNPVAPPSYAWGNEGPSRRNSWHLKFGGNEADGWARATTLRAKAEGQSYTTEFRRHEHP